MPVDEVDPIKTHVEYEIGEIAFLHRNTSDDTPLIDILHIVPSPEKDYHTLVTDGMSKIPMSTPQGVESQQYAELLLCLPSDWPLTGEALEDETSFWPIGLLSHLALMPHKEETWLWWGHTIPNGEPAVPYTPETEFCGSVLVHPMSLNEEALRLHLDDTKTIEFFGVMPVFREELEFLQESPLPAFLQKCAEDDIFEMLSPSRNNLCAS